MQHFSMTTPYHKNPGPIPSVTKLKIFVGLPCSILLVHLYNAQFASLKRNYQCTCTYWQKEWVLLSITSINFWEITTARTSKKRKLNDWDFPAYYDKLLAPRPIEMTWRDNNSCYMVSYRSRKILFSWFM